MGLGGNENERLTRSLWWHAIVELGNYIYMSRKINVSSLRISMRYLIVFYVSSYKFISYTIINIHIHIELISINLKYKDVTCLIVLHPKIYP